MNLRGIGIEGGSGECESKAEGWSDGNGDGGGVDMEMAVQRALLS